MKVGEMWKDKKTGNLWKIIKIPKIKIYIDFYEGMHETVCIELIKSFPFTPKTKSEKLLASIFGEIPQERIGDIEEIVKDEFIKYYEKVYR